MLDGRLRRAKERRIQMQNTSAHSSKWIIIDVFIGFPIIIAIIMQLIFPITITLKSIPNILFIVFSCAIFLIGLLIIGFSRKELSLYNQPTDPGFSTEKIVTSGIYSISRNPMNLGAVLVYLSIGSFLKNIWFLFLLIPTVLLCTQYLIKPEERYLKKKFGEEYIKYFNSVNRWFLKKKNHPTTAST